MNLYGSVLPSISLRFDCNSPYAISTTARQGLKKFGPYDYSRFDKAEIKCGVIYQDNPLSLKDYLVDGLTNGEGSFVGFQKLFRVPLIFEEEQPVTTETKDLERAIDKLINKGLDLVFIIAPAANSELYRASKIKLLGNGIASQVIINKRLGEQSQRPWILENIALASYAKVGGTPWVIANTVPKNQLILGVSRVKDFNEKMLVGFVTLFTKDGDFLFLHSKAPVIEWEKYVESLTLLIVEAIEEYENKRGPPEEIIIHLPKRPGYREVDAIKRALGSISRHIPYALLHLNEYSTFRVFDSGHRTFIPECGLKVDISQHEAVLLIDGRIGDSRRRIGVPRVLDIIMDKRSTSSFSDFGNLVNQVYALSRVNWRGFNAASIPVTVNYSRLIAQMVREVGADNWNQIIAEGKLRDKSWFL